MPWDASLFSSIALLVLMQGSKIEGVSQESVYVIECIRDMIPMQIFNECCVRENNCTVSRQQNRGIDCMSRMIMNNYSSVFMNSHDGGSQTTESPYQYSNSNSNSHSNSNSNNNNNNNNNHYRWYGDVLETLSEICRRQPKGRLQNCIRSELIKRCRYSMLQDRITSSPGNWNQRNGDYSPYNNNNNNNNNGRYGGDRMDSRRFPQQQFYGNRRNYDTGRSEYGDSQMYNLRGGGRGGGGYNSEDTDEEDFGYSDGDSMRYK